VDLLGLTACMQVHPNELIDQPSSPHAQGSTSAPAPRGARRPSAGAESAQGTLANQCLRAHTYLRDLCADLVRLQTRILIRAAL
jgi:hypothetical protein